MKKAFKALFAAFLVTTFCFCVSHAQVPEKGAKNTMTLPNGDVIWDLNGEWDSFVEAYGLWSQYGTHRNMIEITQTGVSLSGVLMMDDPWYPKGYKSIAGELDMNGLKKIEMRTNLGVLDSKGHISQDGNKIIIDDGEKRRMTLTRK